MLRIYSSAGQASNFDLPPRSQRVHYFAPANQGTGDSMKRDGFDKIVSEAVSHALGMQLDVIGQGRVSDGRY